MENQFNGEHHIFAILFFATPVHHQPARNKFFIIINIILYHVSNVQLANLRLDS